MVTRMEGEILRAGKPGCACTPHREEEHGPQEKACQLSLPIDRHEVTIVPAGGIVPVDAERMRVTPHSPAPSFTTTRRCSQPPVREAPR